jgi:hypothetical protein
LVGARRLEVLCVKKGKKRFGGLGSVCTFASLSEGGQYGTAILYLKGIKAVYSELSD